MTHIVVKNPPKYIILLYENNFFAPVGGKIVCTMQGNTPKN